MSRTFTIIIATIIAAAFIPSPAQAGKRGVVRRHNNATKAKAFHNGHRKFRHVKYPYWYYPNRRYVYPTVVQAPPTIVNPVIVNGTQPVLIPSTVNSESQAQVEIVEQQVTQIPVGSTIRLTGQKMNPDGTVIMKWKGRVQLLEVVQWYKDSVEVRIPQMRIKEPVAGEVVVFDGPNKVNTTLAIQLVPSQLPASS